MMCSNCGFDLAEYSNGVWVINGLTIRNRKIICPKCGHDVTDIITGAGIVKFVETPTKVRSLDDLKDYFIKQGLTEEHAQKVSEIILSRQEEDYTFRDFFEDWILPFILALMNFGIITLLAIVF